jgi:uncharacterized protein (DUF2249 family)
MTAGEIVLDVRDLEPPEPFELVTSALMKLQPGQVIKMISPRRPRMLYPWLDERGFAEDTRQRGEDLYEIYIWQGDDTDTAEFVDQVLSG